MERTLIVYDITLLKENSEELTNEDSWLTKTVKVKSCKNRTTAEQHEDKSSIEYRGIIQV